jgi:hypothetical protein
MMSPSTLKCRTVMAACTPAIRSGRRGSSGPPQGVRAPPLTRARPLSPPRLPTASGRRRRLDRIGLDLVDDDTAEAVAPSRSRSRELASHCRRTTHQTRRCELG